MSLSRIKEFSKRSIITTAGCLEYAFASRKPMLFPPVFIFGPPRSGSTLLGQVVSAAMRVSYFPIRIRPLIRSYLPYPPLVTAMWFLRHVRGTHKPDDPFSSDYGASEDPDAATDSDFLWRRILPEEYLEKNSVSRRIRRYIYREVAGVARQFGLPLVDKSVGHSLRLALLAEIFPDAVYVRCRRDVLAVAQSAWIGKMPYGPNAWHTPKTRGHEELLGKSIELQSAAQQFLFEKDIEAGLKSIPAERVIDVDYADVCASPESQVARIAELMSQHGIKTERRRNLPASFDNHNVRKIPREPYEQIIVHLEEYWQRPITRLNEPASEPEGSFDTPKC